MGNKKIDKITCPYCGREYLPAEIFYPKSVLGNPYDIQRDYTGKILDYFDDTYDNTETYVCDVCNSPSEKGSTSNTNHNTQLITCIKCGVHVHPVLLL